MMKTRKDWWVGGLRLDQLSQEEKWEVCNATYSSFAITCDLLTWDQQKDLSVITQVAWNNWSEKTENVCEKSRRWADMVEDDDDGY